MKKQKENSHEGITWSEMGKQNVQAEKVYSHKAMIYSLHPARIINSVINVYIWSVNRLPCNEYILLTLRTQNTVSLNVHSVNN